MDSHLQALIDNSSGTDRDVMRKTANALADMLNSMTPMEAEKWNLENGLVGEDGLVSSPLFHVVNHFLDQGHLLVKACRNEGLTGFGKASLYCTVYPFEASDLFSVQNGASFVSAEEAEKVLLEIEDQTWWTIDGAAGLFKVALEAGITPDESSDLWSAVKASDPAAWQAKRAELVAQAITRRSDKLATPYPTPIKSSSL